MFADALLLEFDCYPYLFWAAFPKLTPEQIQPFSVWARLTAVAISGYDDIIDGTQSSFSLIKAGMSIQAMQFEADKILHSLFPSSAYFWQQFRNYYAKYVAACLQEDQFKSRELPWSELTESIAINIAIDKGGLTRAVISGLAELAQNSVWVEPLTESIVQYTIARQMWDDLCDWRIDLKAGMPSFLLSKVVSQPRDEWTDDELNQIAREIFYGGHANAVLDLALSSLTAAKAPMADLPDLAWWIIIEHLQSNLEKLSKDIHHICYANLQNLQC